MSRAVTPPADALLVLPGAQFADCYEMAIGGPAISPHVAAQRMLGRSPRWVGRLMRLRNAVMAPFGVRVPHWTGTVTPSQIGIFPLVSETPSRVVAGFDDKHLDFRVVVDVTARAIGQSVTATTIVRTHNLLGRAYLATILPFHRLIVRQMLSQVAAP
jgi:hypothetical protein